MRKLLITLCAFMVALIAQAQPMGGGRPPMGGPMGGGRPPMMMGNMEKPFYEAESDSVANARIIDVAGMLDLNEKTLDKMIKLYTQQYEELCRNLQMAVMEYHMNLNGGFRGRNNKMGMQQPANVTFDTESARQTYDKICQKYEKRYKKALNDKQYQVWGTLSSTKLDNKFSNLLQHVQDKTESIF